MSNNKNKLQNLNLMLAMLACLAVVVYVIGNVQLMFLLILLGMLAVLQMLNGLQQRLLQLEQRVQIHPVTAMQSVQWLYIPLLLSSLGFVMHVTWLMWLSLLIFMGGLLNALAQFSSRLQQLESGQMTVPPPLTETTTATTEPQPEHLQSEKTQPEERQPDWMNAATPAYATAETSVALEVQQNKDHTLPDGLQHWFLAGNPILKVAIVVLMIGVVLLLRFVSEHWQLTLPVNLSAIAVAGVAVTVLGYRLRAHNRLYAISLQGIGQATLSLTLFFAHHFLVITDFTVAAGMFVVLLGSIVLLSFLQDAMALAILALGAGYLAPFTLPQPDVDAVYLLAYYLLLNLATAALTSFKPWKWLNHLAFFSTACIGASIRWGIISYNSSIV